MRQFIIGDIHGCHKTFQALLDKIGFSIFDELYLLGDYIDRGPDSKGVLDTILDLKNSGYSLTCLKGNHEQMMLNAFHASSEKETFTWLSNGGNETLLSMGIKNPKDIPPQYIDFCESLLYYKEVGNLILVHAGLNFTQANPLTVSDDMLWLRDWYETVSYQWLGKRYIVHGHTSLSQSRVDLLFEFRNKQRVINLDAAAVFGSDGKYGCHLCCLDWTNEVLFFQKTIDKIED